MSDPLCKVGTISAVQPFPDPSINRLHLGRIDGWWTMMPKVIGVGDVVVHIQPDAVLPPEAEAFFLKGSKFPLTGGRVTARFFKDVVSYGLVVPLHEVCRYVRSRGNVGFLPLVGEDISSVLGVRRYEEPEEEIPECLKGQCVPRHPQLRNLSKINRWENTPDVLTEGEPVDITEKLHGTFFTAANLPRKPRTIWEKLVKACWVFDEWELVYASSERQYANGVHNVYSDVAQGVHIPKGTQIFGEIVGPGIQKGYSYGFTSPSLFVFDVIQDGRFLSDPELRAFCKGHGLTAVPLLYTGPFLKALVPKAHSGISMFGFEGPVREGCVIRASDPNVRDLQGRRVYKSINPAFLAADNTAFH